MSDQDICHLIGSFQKQYTVSSVGNSMTTVVSVVWAVQTAIFWSCASQFEWTDHLKGWLICFKAEKWRGQLSSPHNLALSVPWSHFVRLYSRDRQRCSTLHPCSFFLWGSGSAHVITRRGRRCSSATDSILDCCQLYGRIWPISLFSVSHCISVTISHWWEELFSC